MLGLVNVPSWDFYTCCAFKYTCCIICFICFCFHWDVQICNINFGNVFGMKFLISVLEILGWIVLVIAPLISVVVLKVNVAFESKKSLYTTPSVANIFVFGYLPVASNKSKYLLIPLAVLLDTFCFNNFLRHS